MRRAGLRIAGVVVGVAVALFLVDVSRAEEGGVVINEIMWDGVEYLELFNMASGEVPLEGWTLTRQQVGGEVKTIVQFGEGDVIAAGDYYLLEKNEEATTVLADKLVSGLTLVNTGELVTLLDKEEAVVHQANQLGAWLAGENTVDGVAMERGEDGWYTSTGNVGGRVGTAGEANSEPGVTASPEPEEGGEDAENYSDAITVNEFLPNPVGSDTEGEFIELKNVEDEEVSLAGWRVDDEEGGSGAYVIPEGTVIEPGGLVVFWRSETGLALNNEGDQARLFSPDGEVKSSQQYDESGAEGVARARNEEGTWQWSTTPTPGQPNVITQPEEEETEDGEGEDATYPDTIVINEFLPNPKGSDTEGEFVELKNTGSEEVDLEGWRIDDGEGGSSPYKIPAGVSLAGGDYYVFWRADTKLAFNNGGDEVKIFDPAGNIKSSFVYEEEVIEAVSYNRTDSGEYVLSTTVTPGGDNVITEPVSEDGEGSSDKSGVVAGAVVTKVLLKDIRGQAVGTMVETEGVVSAPPGIFGGKVMYIAGSGIQIYLYGEEYPELEVGDRVRVRGELGTSLGEYRVKLAATEDMSVVGKDVVPEPHRVSTGEVGEGLEGSLVMIAGRVSRTSGDTFYVDDGGGEIKVFVKQTTGIDKPKMKKGTEVTIMGVVSRTNTGYRILPRWQEDVRLGLVAGLASFPGAGWLPGPFGVAGLVAGLALVLARRAGEPLALLAS